MTPYLESKLANQLNYLLKIEKLYLRTDLSLPLAAELLNTNRTYLAEVVQKHFNTNFVDLINSHRIEEVQRLLKKAGSSRVHMGEIAEQAGFYSKSSFNLVFKRYTGTTPSQYRKMHRQIQNNMLASLN